MTREEALLAITSTEAEERLKAARFFALNSQDKDHKVIRKALRSETIPWIKRALERSLSKSVPPQEAGTSSETFYSPDKRDLAKMRAAAIDEVASTIIHELATIVGRLKISAPSEIAEYSSSKTKNLIDSLSSLLAGIRNLKTAAGKPEFIEIDLSAECRETCEIFHEVNGIFRFAGPSPFMSEIDQGLFKLALSNVIRNAVEAISSQPNDEDSTITLNWGRAGSEVWVAVLDNGPGFEGDPFSLVNFGKTTKEEHIGFGLATAQQAMQAMEGDIYPTNSREGGARVELRWFGEHEDTVR